MPRHATDGPPANRPGPVRWISGETGPNGRCHRRRVLVVGQPDRSRRRARRASSGPLALRDRRRGLHRLSPVASGAASMDRRSRRRPGRPGHHHRDRVLLHRHPTHDGGQHHGDRFTGSPGAGRGGGEAIRGENARAGDHRLAVRPGRGGSGGVGVGGHGPLVTGRGRARRWCAAVLRRLLRVRQGSQDGALHDHSARPTP